MIRPLTLLFLFLFSGTAYSQSNDHKLIIPGCEKVHYGKASTGIPSYIKLSDRVNAEGLHTWMAKVFRLNKDHSFKVLKSEADDLGFTHRKYQQYYKNYPVIGAIYIVHEKDNHIHSLNGLIEDKLSVDTKVSLSEGQALNKALGYMKGEKYIWEDQNEEAHLKSISQDPSASYYPKGELVIVTDRLGKGAYRLAYKFDVYSVRPLRRAYVYVDANDGSVININDRIHHHTNSDPCHTDGLNESANANAIGTAATKYSGSQNITTELFGGSYRLRDQTRGSGIQTWNMQRGVSYGSAVDFTDLDNLWNTTTNYDNAAYDAHWGAAKTYDYYLTVHSRNSYNGSGAIMYNYVHYDVGYDNAYWDGNRMTYGDGSNTFGGFTALTAVDVVGHELTHGVTQYTADLTYSGESGALNESFSDIMGTTIEYYAKPASANFLIGDQISYGGGALRNMANPNQYYQPDTYLGDDWDFGQEVHTNSGVGNFWYYLVCMGGSGTNDVGSTYSVTGIGMTKAAKIAYRTLSTYLTPDATYADARFYSIQAAMDLYLPCSPEVQAVTNAWYAVGVGNAYVAGVSPEFSANATSFCSAPAVVTFNNLSQNANAFTWTFGDGSPTSTAANPTHTYASYGTYTVTLAATGGACGSNTNTKTSYIVVSNLVSCPVNMPRSGSGQTQTKCTGKLYDSGGLSNYQDLTDGTITITPNAPAASKITLTFSSFNLETDYDYLYIYDGPSTSSPLIGAYTGVTLPNGGTINSTGGSITLRQFSDTYLNYSGFDCDWSCTVPTSSPVAAFSGNPTISCDGVVNFTDQSSNGPTSWSWNFGDGTTSTAQHPVKTYAANGTYNVSLQSCNGIGCSTTLVKNNYVSVNLGSCVYVPQSGTGVTQTACTGKLYDSGGSSNYHNGTNGTITIAPSGATKVTLNFTEFNFESGFDYLYVYNGPSTSSPLIGQYSGNTLPAGGTIVSSGGSITLRQVTDGTITYAGFVCNWSCTLPTSAPVTAFSANQTSTCDGIINFTDQSTNGPTSWTWDFGDATSSTSQNPVKTYASNGTYTVKLNACNSFGCNLLTKTSYVTVSLGGCVNLPQIGTGTTQTTCSGRLYDSGGNNDYQNSTSGSITISPAGATKVNLNFSAFSFEAGYDSLYIYNGTSTSSPLIGAYSGTSLPGGGTVSSTGGSITIKQSTDGSIVRSGFVCDWSCVIPNSAPSSAFTSNTAASCNGVIVFTDQSTNSPTSWTWDFGDGTTSTSQNPTKTYTTSGTFNVSLSACNTFGCNTITKNSFITISLSNCATIPVSGTGTTKTTCTGRLYDSGGLGNYQNNTNGIITIAPTGATKVTLTFSAFSFESSYDFIYIYDGPTTSSPLIGSYSGTTLPGFGTINSTGGSITIKQTSDVNTVFAGFVCDWSCSNTNSMPSSGTAPTKTACSGTFTDSGGNNDYGTNTDGFMTISTTSGSHISLNFSSFSMEDGVDYLVVYDGPSSSSPMIAAITGDSSNPFVINSSGNSITLEQYSDFSIESSGFVCSWSCVSGLNKNILKDAEIVLFPNPASDEITILCNYSGTKQLDVAIYDLLGNVVYKDEGTFSNKYQNKLNVSSFPEGVYLVKISDGQGAINKKLTITK
jgi:Zn-dependent metalloprotease